MEPAPWPEAALLLAPLAPWFDSARRSLPWRAGDLDQPHPDPYAVLVSELMLQQTQVATVIPYFDRWLDRFPDSATLAAATEDEVHKAWEGLGYYRRARHLRAASAIIATQGWPNDLAGLLALPGLGPYTAAAVAAIAFQWPEPALDGNAFRVLARILALAGDPKAQAPSLRTWLAPALQRLGPSRLTQALMELGATVCGPIPRCGACPMASSCLAQQKGLQAVLPPPTKRAQPKRLDLLLLAVEAGGSFLVQKPSDQGLLAGLWTWPAAVLEPAVPPAAKEPPSGGTPISAWPGWTQVYTHRREEVKPHHLRVLSPFPAQEGFHWVPLHQLEALPMGKRDGRLRDLLGTPGQPSEFLEEAHDLLNRLREPDAGPGR